MRLRAAGIVAMGAALAAPTAAHAGVDSVHVGVVAHNVCLVIDCKNGYKEDGVSVEFQVSFESPEYLEWLGAPRPYALASINTAGETSFGGVGFEWRWRVAEDWAVEPGLGYVIHDGETNNPFANGTPEAAAFAHEHLLLGSRDLFRVSLGVTRDLPGPWEAQAFYTHLSHGQIIGDGRNQGLDQVGLRIGYRFGE